MPLASSSAPWASYTAVARKPSLALGTYLKVVYLDVGVSRVTFFSLFVTNLLLSSLALPLPLAIPTRRSRRCSWLLSPRSKKRRFVLAPPGRELLRRHRWCSFRDMRLSYTLCLCYVPYDAHHHERLYSRIVVWTKTQPTAAFFSLVQKRCSRRPHVFLCFLVVFRVSFCQTAPIALCAGGDGCAPFRADLSECAKRRFHLVFTGQTMGVGALSVSGVLLHALFSALFFVFHISSTPPYIPYSTNVFIIGGEAAVSVRAIRVPQPFWADGGLVGRGTSWARRGRWLV